jgi:hypothetical protein
MPCPVRSARTPALLSTPRNARSEVGPKMWRVEARRGRAGQAFELGGPDTADGTTANSLSTGGWGPPGNALAAHLRPG